MPAGVIDYFSHFHSGTRVRTDPWPLTLRLNTRAIQPRYGNLNWVVVDYLYLVRLLLSDPLHSSVAADVMSPHAPTYRCVVSGGM